MSKKSVAEWVSATEAARLLGVSPSTVRNRARGGDIMHRRGSQDQRQRFQIAVNAAREVLDVDGNAIPGPVAVTQSDLESRLESLENAIARIQGAESATTGGASHSLERDLVLAQSELERAGKVIRLLAEAVVVMSESRRTGQDQGLSEVLGSVVEDFLRDVAR